MDLRSLFRLLVRAYAAIFLMLGLMIAGGFFYVLVKFERPPLQEGLILILVLSWVYSALTICLQFLLPERFKTTESAWLFYGRYWTRHFYISLIAVGLIMAALALTWPDE